MCCSVNGSVCLVCCVFVNCLIQFAICLSVVIEVLRVGGGPLFDRPCMVFQEICVNMFLP